MARLEEYWLPNSVKKSLYLEGRCQKHPKGGGPSVLRPSPPKITESDMYRTPPPKNGYSGQDPSLIVKTP